MKKIIALTASLFLLTACQTAPAVGNAPSSASYEENLWIQTQPFRFLPPPGWTHAAALHPKAIGSLQSPDRQAFIVWIPFEKSSHSFEGFSVLKEASENVASTLQGASLEPPTVLTQKSAKIFSQKIVGEKDRLKLFYQVSVFSFSSFAGEMIGWSREEGRQEFEPIFTKFMESLSP